MQQFTQKYTIIHFLNPLPNGAEFASTDWPLHVTLAETFAIQQDLPTLIDSISTVARHHEPVRTTAVNEANFGPNQDIPVILIDMPPTLMSLHNDIVSSLESNCGASFNNPHYIKDGYVAHSTIRSDTQLHRGDSIIIDSLSIVDMFPDSDPYRRKIISTFPLGR